MIAGNMSQKKTSKEILMMVNIKGPMMTRMELVTKKSVPL